LNKLEFNFKIILLTDTQTDTGENITPWWGKIYGEQDLTMF